jgi:2-succinyl-6-hydroxy-2,4-cyclohexadiene-1-carboxylate synthase
VEQRIEVNGVHIGGIQQHNAGYPLVFLHGFTGCAASWNELIPRFAAYDLACVALDMLGHGESSAPDDPARYRIQACCDDIISVLLQLGIRAGEAILLGYSMGGRIALYTAFSGFFRALVLESASPGLANPGERDQRRVRDEALADRIERDGVAKFIDYWEQLPLFASQSRLPPEQRAALRRQRLRNRAVGLANSLRGVGTAVQPALHAQLPDLTIPVLLITGALDTKFCAIAREMMDLLPLAQWYSIENAGHTAHLEQPEVFCRVVGEFCQQCYDR